MAKYNENGGIIGPATVPTGNFGSAPGVWKLAEVEKYIKEGIWPVATTGFQVQNSCRFDNGSSDNLNKTYSSDGNRRTFTVSVWVKCHAINSNEQSIFCAGDAANQRSELKINGSRKLTFFDYNSSFDAQLETNALLRDVNAWYHIVLKYDTTQATSSDRIKLYLNGEEQSLSTSTIPAQNHQSYINLSSKTHRINQSAAGGDIGEYTMAEVVFLDGQSLGPTSFGETDSTTNNWVPKDVSGLTFGTNGFYLRFQNASALGQDDSGNGNNFTVNNLTSINQCVDTCTNNFATMNSLQYSPNTQFSDGNLTIKQVVGGNAHRRFLSTLGVSQGKYYWETKCVDNPSTFMNGISDGSGGATSYANFIGELTNGVGYYGNGNIYKNGSSVASGLATFSAGDIINIALDLDNNYIYFGVNGTWINSGDPTSGSSGTGGFSVNSGNTYFAGVSMFTNNQSSNVNFGNAPFSISSGNTDYSGLGNFEYEVPSGYRALCTKNIGLVG